MDSVWTKNVKMPEFKRLDGDIKTGVLIIGGGIAGLLCAYMLDKKGADYILLESDNICGKVTKNTTAKITSQHGFIYDKLIGNFGLEKAGLYLEANEAALSEYKKICAGIDCDFEEKDAFLYSADDEEKLLRELDALDKIDFSADFVKNLPLPFKTAGAVKFKNQAQFNPLKFAAAISEGLNIYENTRVTELLDSHTAVTQGGRVTADKIIAATHFPFINKHGSYF